MVHLADHNCGQSMRNGGFATMLRTENSVSAWPLLFIKHGLHKVYTNHITFHDMQTMVTQTSEQGLLLEL